MSVLRSSSPALKALDRQCRIIYLGSFSKSLFPGLRLVYIVAPEVVIGEARGLRSLVTRHSPGITQRTTAYFLALGYYDAHIKRIHDEFRARGQIMIEALAREGMPISEATTTGGASLWLGV